MAMFPSIEWFETARARANADDRFRRLGSADARFGVKVDAAVYTVALEAFEVAAVGTATVDELAELDFYLDLPAPRWQAYVGALAGGARQYLSDLDLATSGGIVKGAARNRLLFPRYNQTIERFFELGAGA